MITRKCVVAAFFSLLPSVSPAAEHEAVPINERKVTQTPECARQETCDVKEVGIWVRDYHVDVGNQGKLEERNYGTELYAWYETRSLGTLEDYVFVQYIRGCQFRSQMKDGQRKIDHTIVRKVYAPRRYEPLFFPNWTIDSDDPDPVYGSSIASSSSRRFLMRWNTSPNVFPSPENERLYSRQKPDIPRLHITDLTGQAFFSQYPGYGVAYNTSLEFRTCLYREADVPRVHDARRPIIAKPIACFHWRSSFVFDHERMVFRSPQEIVNDCKGRPIRDERVRDMR